MTCLKTALTDVTVVTTIGSIGVTRQPMIVGIVGHEAAKFTTTTEYLARREIRELVIAADMVVSGHCHLGGVDIWAEEEAVIQGKPYLIYPPKTLKWSGGYKERNLQIAQASDVVHCIVVKELPPGYHGMRFKSCYHCGTKDHIKSGGCWTARRAKSGVWHIV